MGRRLRSRWGGGKAYVGRRVKVAAKKKEKGSKKNPRTTAATTEKFYTGVD